MNKDYLPWTKKHEPKSVSGIAGQDSGIEQLRFFISSYANRKMAKPAALIYGPPGCGKTCAVYALASDMGYEVLEINASDYRNKQEIEKIAGASSGQMSLFNKGKIIFIDEIDGISGRYDRGCAQAIASIASKSGWPVVLAANNPWSDKLKSVRKACALIEFKPLESVDITKILKRICDNENLPCSETSLRSIAHRCGGDARAAINDLQSAVFSRKKINIDAIGYRESEENIFNALRLIFKSSSAADVLRSLDNVDMEWRECIMWIDENIPLEYHPKFLKEAYHWVSRADVFNGRISRQQYWRFLVYFYALITAGVATAKKEKKTGFTEYRRSTRILKLWQAKMRYSKKESIVSKIATHNHVSKKIARRDIFPLFHSAFKLSNGRNLMAESLELDENEVSWLIDH